MRTSTKEKILILTDSLVKKETFSFIKGGSVGNLQVECISNIHHRTENFFERLLSTGDDSNSARGFSLYRSVWTRSQNVFIENILILQEPRESTELFLEESIP